MGEFLRELLFLAQVSSWVNLKITVRKRPETFTCGHYYPGASRTFAASRGLFNDNRVKVRILWDKCHKLTMKPVFSRIGLCSRNGKGLPILPILGVTALVLWGLLYGQP
jgi:hypothetical protein